MGENSKYVLAAYQDIVRAYCQEFDNWSFFSGTAKYDEELSSTLSDTCFQNFLKIEFSSQEIEVFVPLSYVSLLGEHGIGFPILFRPLGNAITELEPIQFIKLACREAYGLRGGLERKRPQYVLAQFIGKIKPEEQTLWKRKQQKQSFRAFKVADADGLSRQAAEENVPLEEKVESALLGYIDQALSFFGQQSEFQLDKEKSGPEGAGPNRLELILFEKLFPLIGELGREYGLEERALLNIVYKHLLSLRNSGNSEMISNVLHQRYLTRNLTFLQVLGRELGRVPNPLHLVFRLDRLFIHPLGSPVFQRFFPKQELMVRIRSINLENDLEMLHEWFNRDHAKAIWQMDWPIEKLESYYRKLLLDPNIQSFIGEINGAPTFNVEVYWPTRDILGDYYEVAPDDYGTHLFIAPVEKEKKHSSLITQAILDWLYSYPEVKRLVGEGAVESKAALMNKIHVGFKLQGIIEMPHKKAHLNTCYREWYYEKFPENEHIEQHIIKFHLEENEQAAQNI